VPAFWKHHSETAQPQGLYSGLSQLQSPADQTPQNNLQWCVEDIDSDGKPSKKCVFADLNDNSEVYTAYQGAPVWKAIYDENCIQQGTLEKSEKVCDKDTLLYQMISGLHTSINSQISVKFSGDSAD
jgi:hypothetical protein